MRREAILEVNSSDSLQHCDPKPAEATVIDADPEGSQPLVKAFAEQVEPAVRYVQSNRA